jgi:hypothetical protein
VVVAKVVFVSKRKGASFNTSRCSRFCVDVGNPNLWESWRSDSVLLPLRFQDTN